jgi:hypothetical protein
MNVLELQAIAQAGGGMTVDASDYNSLEMQSVARMVTSMLVIRNALRYNSMECQAIARMNPGKVYFDFTQ